MRNNATKVAETLKKVRCILFLSTLKYFNLMKQEDYL